MCTLLLKAAAAATPRTSLRLLRTGLAAMSTAGPLKSVDYEVFGRVQGRGPPPPTVGDQRAVREKGDKTGRGPSHLKDPLPRRGRDFRRAMTQQPRVGRKRKAHALESCAGRGRGKSGTRGRGEREGAERRRDHWGSPAALLKGGRRTEREK